MAGLKLNFWNSSRATLESIRQQILRRYPDMPDDGTMPTVHIKEAEALFTQIKQSVATQASQGVNR